MSLAVLKQAFLTDVSPVLAMARARCGRPIDPVAAYRAAGYRAAAADRRR
jgi:L-rhamnose isomerase/sugar isomerase